jgi:hypothetical protein
MYSRANTVPKSQLTNTKLKYVEHYWHTIPREERKWNLDYIQILSVDPGLKNYTILIQRRMTNGITFPLLYNKLDFTSDDESSHYGYLLHFFESQKELIKGCHIFLIERQLPQNYKMVRISQHTISYIMFQTLNNSLLPSIYEVDTKLKGIYLGVKKSDDVKKIAIERAIQLLTSRNDKYSLSVLNNTKKKDDLADVIIQIEALFYELQYFQIPILPIPEPVIETSESVETKTSVESIHKSTPRLILKNKN